MRPLILLPLALLLVGAAPPMPRIQSGEWRITLTMLIDTANGIRLPTPVSHREEERECLNAEDSALTLFDGTNLENCTFRHPVAGDGRISFAATCEPDEDGFSSTFTANGTYTPDRVDLDLQLQASADENSMSGNGHIEARRIGACKARP